MAVWTGVEILLWGGLIDEWETFDTETHAYDPAADRWRRLPPAGEPPDVRAAAAAVWTGDALLVWGGTSPSGRREDPPPLATGFRLQF